MRIVRIIYAFQIETQQRQLSESCEEDIAARHLIVDLQSKGQDKFLIAKMGRDINRGI